MLTKLTGRKEIEKKQDRINDTPRTVGQGQLGSQFIDATDGRTATKNSHDDICIHVSRKKAKEKATAKAKAQAQVTRGHNIVVDGRAGAANPI